MDLSTHVPAVLGGLMCGAGTVGLLATHGRIAGISGLLGRACDVVGERDRGSLVAFLLGLPLAGALVSVGAPALMADSTATPIVGVVLAGTLVGAGSALGNGCTSGHGVCGVARTSPRSFVAVGLFCVVAAISLRLTHWVLAGAS